MIAELQFKSLNISTVFSGYLNSYIVSGHPFTLFIQQVKLPTDEFKSSLISLPNEESLLEIIKGCENQIQCEPLNGILDQEKKKANNLQLTFWETTEVWDPERLQLSPECFLCSPPSLSAFSHPPQIDLPQTLWPTQLSLCLGCCISLPLNSSFTLSLS